MRNADKAKQIADSYDGDICDADDIQTACLAMARWKDEQLKQTLPITEMSENSTNEFKHKFHIELDDMKGFVTRSVLASCKYKHYDSKTDTMSEENNKALVAITVISARDYQPHAMISVIVNGKETGFGTNMKKAIEFYNKA